MTAHFPDVDTVCAALTLANRAPSVHNSQPWHWRVGPRSLHLYAQSSLSLPRTDPDGRELMVSCGAALHHCTIAFAALGWRAVIHRFPDPAQPEHLASLELRRERALEVDIALAAAIPCRRTDRRYYSAWPVALGDIALMGARAARLGVTMRRLETTTEFRALLAQAVWTHVTDDEYLGELMAWSGRHASEVGVPARNTPESDPAAAVPGRLFARTALAQPEGVTAAGDNGIVLALGTADDDYSARLRAGEATSAVLLTATAKGLASCPVSEVLEVAETRNGLRRSAFCDGQVPQMLIRVGWAPLNADPLRPSPRRPLAETVSRLDGGPLL
jgi:nitroreductase